MSVLGFPTLPVRLSTRPDAPTSRCLGFLLNLQLSPISPARPPLPSWRHTSAPFPWDPRWQVTVIARGQGSRVWNLPKSKEAFVPSPNTECPLCTSPHGGSGDTVGGQGVVTRLTCWCGDCQAARW